MRKSLVRKEFRVPSALSEVCKTSSRVLRFLKPLGLDDARLFEIRLSLEEGLINAMKYGNRLRREVPVRLLVEYGGAEVRITIEDRGKGFDVKRLEDCTRRKNLLKGCGRGIFLIYQLMDEVRFNSKGNRLLMVKRVREEGAASWR